MRNLMEFLYGSKFKYLSKNVEYVVKDKLFSIQEFQRKIKFKKHEEMSLFKLSRILI